MHICTRPAQSSRLELQKPEQDVILLHAIWDRDRTFIIHMHHTIVLNTFVLNMYISIYPLKNCHAFVH